MTLGIGILIMLAVAHTILNIAYITYTDVLSWKTIEELKYSISREIDRDTVGELLFSILVLPGIIIKALLAYELTK